MSVLPVIFIILLFLWADSDTSHHLLHSITLILQDLKVIEPIFPSSEEPALKHLDLIYAAKLLNLVLLRAF